MPSDKNKTGNRAPQKDYERSEHIASEQIERFSHMESNVEKEFDITKMQGKPSKKDKGGQ